MQISKQCVDLIDCMGSDLTITNSARVSFNKESVWEIDTEKDEDVLSDKDARLIKYLAQHNHWSPFAHTCIQLRVKAPIFVARQLVKHQIGLVWNEVSRRYVDSEPEFYFPKVWRGRPEGSIKQGSAGVVERVRFHDNSGNGVEYSVDGTVRRFIAQSLSMYQDLIDGGVAPELARIVLPVNVMTEWYWTGSLMAFCRVCRERLAPGAQAETREVAEMIAEIVAPLFPVGWAALMGEKA